MSISLILLAIGLAADAFAVAIGQGAAVRTHPWRSALTVGAAFGAAQAIAPLIGWSLTLVLAGVIESVDHWIAFVLLALVGAKMIWEGLRKDPPGEESDPGKEKVAGGWTLLMLAVATSIDAAAAGITLPALGAPILLSVAAIGLITFALSTAGVMIGRAGAKALGSQAEIIGGLILIVIGAKVLIDHNAFG
ncbi:MAG: manganese efflux pump MntP family protein [Hyphomonadaceae bacterium]|nr:manganese efflux pump MntP family protein [Hyphomonadaceae bacterium]